MVIKVSDILKDARTYTTTGLAMMAIWIFFTAAYTEHQKNQRYTRDLAAYLLIKDALTLNLATTYFFENKEEVAPAETNNILQNPPKPSNAIMSCNDSPAKKFGMNGPIEKKHQHRYLECKNIEISFFDQSRTNFALQFKLLPSYSNEISGYYEISSIPESLPIPNYRLILTKHNDDSSEVLRGIMPPADANSTDDISTERQEFQAQHDIYIVRADIAETFLKPVGDDTAKPTDSLLRAAIETGPQYQAAREPRYWIRSSALLTGAGGTPTLADLHLNDPAVLRLITQYIDEDTAYDLVGIKVRLSQIPWAIAIILTMLACLLTGTYSSLKLAAGDSLTEDTGWLLLQGRQRYGLPPIISSGVLLFMTASLFVYTIVLTIRTALSSASSPAFALIFLIGAICFFGATCSINVFQQIRLSNSRQDLLTSSS